MRQHIDGCEPLKALVAQAGISLRTAYKWLARYRSGGHTSLVDRAFAAPKGGRSIPSNCSTHWTSHQAFPILRALGRATHEVYRSSSAIIRVS